MHYLATVLYKSRLSRITRHRPETTLKVICLSDTHNNKPKVPDGDLLIHAGDLSQSGSLEEVQEAIDWLQSLSHAHKVVVAGNHDLVLDSDGRSRIRWGKITYLQDQSQRINFANGRALTIFGSPWTSLPGTWAFQYPRAYDKWTGKVPLETDILVTHVPPKFHLDAGLGDENLLREMTRIKPQMHIFGHIHVGRGQDHVLYDDFETSFENVLRSGSWLSFARMLFQYLSFLWSPQHCHGTVLVNAAMVGGFRDTERRTPIELLI